MINPNEILKMNFTESDIAELFSIATNQAYPYNPRHDAIIALGKIGPKSIPKLKMIILDAHPGYRQAAIRAISSMGRKAKLTASFLAKGLMDEDKEARLATIFALGKIGGEGPSYLLKSLKRKNREEQAAILEVLKTYVPFYLKSIIKMSSQQQGDDAFWARQLLLTSGFPPESITALIGKTINPLRRKWLVDKLYGAPDIPGDEFHTQIRSELKTIVMFDSSGTSFLEVSTEALVDNYNIHIFQNPKSAIDHMTSNKPDILTSNLTDIGIGFIKIVREKWPMKTLPIIAISNLNKDEAFIRRNKIDTLIPKMDIYKPDLLKEIIEKSIK